VETKILLIDDEVRILHTFARTLRLAGYTVITAAGGQEGLAFYHQEEPDVVLLDLRMPGIGGLEVLQAIRKQDPEANVILCTAHGDKDAVIDALRAGASDFLPKPIDQVTLESALRRAEERIHLKRELRASQEALRRHNERLEEEVKARTAELEREIEERKRAEQTLYESKERLEKTFKSQRDAIFVLDAQKPALIVDCNPAATRIFGYTREEMLGRTTSFLHVDESTLRHFQDQLYLAIAEQGYLHLPEFRMKRKDGTLFFTAHSVMPLENEEGERVGWISVVRDITERKRAKEGLRENEEKYRLLAETTPDIIALHDMDGRIVYLNQAGLNFAGFEPSEAIGQPITTFIPPEHRADLQTRRMQRAEGDEGTYRYEIEFVDRAGKRIPAEVYSTPIVREGQVRQILLVARDISGRKETEKALRESESRIRRKLNSILSPDSDLGALDLADLVDVEAIQAMMDNFYVLTGIGVAVVDLQGEILVATGWQEICTRFHRGHPETEQHCIESDTALSSGIEPGQRRLYKCKNNLWDMATPIVIGDQHVGNIFLGQFFFDDEQVDRELFREQARAVGFDEEAYLAALDQVPRWSRETVEAAFELYTRFATMVSQLSHSNLKLARALAEKERLLTARRESERKFRSYIDNAPFGVFVADEQGHYVEVNETACRLTGYDRNELLTMRITQLAPPDLLHTAEAHFRAVVEEGVSTGEVQFLTKEGERRWWSIIAVRLSETRFLGYTDDITERKRAEEALRRQNRYLQALQGTTLELISQLDLEILLKNIVRRAGSLLGTSSGFLNLVDQQADQLVLRVSVGAVTESLKPTVQLGEGMAGKVWQTGKPVVVDDYDRWENRIPGFRYDRVSAMIGVPLLSGEEVLGVLGLAYAAPSQQTFGAEEIDLLIQFARLATVAIENARLLEQTQRDAKAKALLLREVNHRVLNNLTAIIGILDMEQRRSVDDGADFRAVLSDVNSRIGGMVTVHRMLSHAQWAPLNLSQVVERVIHAALSGSPIQSQVEVTVDTRGDPLHVMSKQAIAVALVINELTTNSVKYAFNDRTEGQIHVKIAPLDEEREEVELVFRDDGPGMPAEALSGEQHSVGIWLVETNVTHQLGGTIDFRNDGGAVASIVFKRTPLEQAAPSGELVE
jgi:PAS domain S-box-containing protein